MGRAVSPSLLAALAIAAAHGFACSRPAQLAYEERARTVPATGRHAVENARLADHMLRLDRLRTARLPQGLDLESRTLRHREMLAEVAKELADSAGRIPDFLGASDFDPVERHAFARFAEELEGEARALAREASDRPAELLRARIGRIDAACTRCHDRFRIPFARDSGADR